MPGHRYSRDPALIERDLVRIRNKWPQQPAVDLTRAEQRFAAEVALAQFHAQLIPTFAQERAVQILSVLAAA